MTGSIVRLISLPAGGLFALLAVGACQGAPGQVPSTEPDDARADAAVSAAARDDGSALDATSDAATWDAATPEAGVALAEPLPASDAGALPPLFLQLPDPVAHLAHGDEQTARLCASKRDDLISDLFCSGRAPRITSLAELLALLGVDPRNHAGTRGFAITGHSTGLSKRSVSAINPRVIFMHVESPSEPPLAVAFTRGETMVEIVTRSRPSGELQFYAIAFTLPCSEAERGCSPGELLTSAIERDWQRVDVYHEEELKNTAIDCRVCHQTEGLGTAKLLRMQELEISWTHWFDAQTRGGRALIADFHAFHGDAPFAGIPGELITYAAGGLAAAFVRIGGSPIQPNEFKSKEIEIEVERVAPEQPANNQVRGRSETWQRLYEVALRAEAIPLPYHDVKITDPHKLARMQQTYAEYRAGRIARSALPDIRDVLPDDPVVLAEMGFMLDERLEDRALLTAACGLCHNGRLDQSLSRARFHLDLERLSPAEKQLAIERLRLPGHDLLAMPPRRIFELSDAARDRLVALLRR